MADRYRTLAVALGKITGHTIGHQWITDLRAFFDEHLQPGQEGEKTAHEEALTKWRSEERKVRQEMKVPNGDRAERRAGARFVATYGSLVSHGDTENQARNGVHTAWTGKHPQPQRVELNFATWQARYPAKQESRWRITLIDADGGETELAAVLPTAGEQYVPVAEVNAHLSALSDDGWHLVHVSEDKGVYTGAVAYSESYVARQRYLLRQRR